MITTTYLKNNWRNIKKRPGFSILNIGGLVLGLTSSMLLLLYVNYHINFDKQFRDADRIYKVYNNQTGEGKMFTFGATPLPMAPTIKSTVPGVEDVIRVQDHSDAALISYGENNFKKSGIFADPAFFNFFSYHFIHGQAGSALQNINSVVITKQLAEILFGNDNPLGKIVKRNSQTSLMVTGVIDTPPLNSSLQFDYIMNFSLYLGENPWTIQAGWGSNFLGTYVKLKSVNSFAAADGIIRKMLKANQQDYQGEAFLYPYLKTHLYSKFENGVSVGGMIDQIKLLFILALAILLIACVNFMNLSTARSEERAKEVGIRKAIGSGKTALVLQFLSESVLLSFIAMVLAVLLLIICLPYFNDLLSLKLQIPYNNWFFYLFLLALTLITGLVAGSYPAFYLSSFNPVKVLKGTFKGNAKVLSIRKLLVIIQFGFAAFLITATVVIFKQISFIQQLPIGYDRGNLVEIAMEGALKEKLPLLINDLKSSGTIAAASPLSQSITQSGSNTWGYEWPGKRPDEKILFDALSAGFDFVKTTGISLTAGRDFRPDYPADTAQKSIMLNQTAVNLMHLNSPLGTIIRYGDRAYTVIGVFKDFVWGSPYKKTAPMVVSYNSQGYLAALKLNPSKSVSTAVSRIEEKLKEINPAFPPDIRFVDKSFESKFKNEKLLASLSNLFGGLAIAISSLGLFGLAAYAAEKRNKEIGIRKVLGAGIVQVMGILTRDFIRLVFIANLVAIPISYYAMHAWLQDYEYHIGLNWWIFALVTLLTIVIAFCTVSFQAYRAAIVNPLKSIKSE